MAIVRTWEGSPPPAKPYFQHPAAVSARASATRLEMPDRRIERLNSIGALDDEGEGAARFLTAVLNPAIRRTVDPLEEAAVADAFQAGEGVAMEGDAPAGWGANVGPQDGPLDAHGRVAIGRELKPSQRRPQQWTRGNQLANQVRSRNL